MGGGLQEDSLVLLQELPRAPTGWQQLNLASWKIVGHRSDEQCGNRVDVSSCPVECYAPPSGGKGYLVPPVQHGNEIWAGSIYLKPELSQDEHAVSLQEFLRKLPATQLPVIVSGGSNSEIAWGPDEQGVSTALGRNGKTLGLLHWLASRGLQVVPTTRPRQQDRAGKQIDFLATARLGVDRVNSIPESHGVIGTDHDLLSVKAGYRKGERRPKTDTRPRQLVTPIPAIDEITQTKLVALARRHTKPKPGSGYRDPEDVRALFRMARFSKQNDDWKKAFQARRKARYKWEQDQVASAVQGDWNAFRKVRKRTKNDWELGFADANDNPHTAIHNHLQSVYQSNETVQICAPELEFSPITLDELKYAVQRGKTGVSVSRHVARVAAGDHERGGRSRSH